MMLDHYADWIDGRAIALGQAQLITRDVALRIRSFNSAAGVTLTLVVRQISAYDGKPIIGVVDHIPNTDRSAKTTIYPLAEGWLVGVQVLASGGSPRRGQCFVRVELLRGFDGEVGAVLPLVQSYVQDTTGPAWPGTPLTESTEGRGVITSTLGANPAAGAECSDTVPTNARWRLIAYDVPLVTSATVANRETVLTIDDGANIVAEIASGTAHAASLTRRLVFAKDVQRGGPAASTIINAPLPDLYLMGGYRVRTVTANLDATDDYGAPRLWYEEWIED